MHQRPYNFIGESFGPRGRAGRAERGLLGSWVLFPSLHLVEGMGVWLRRLAVADNHQRMIRNEGTNAA